MDVVFRMVIAAHLHTVAAVQAVASQRREREDRGDVPGWVMITVMTAALVVAILIPFKAAIVGAVQTALNNVTGAAAGKSA